jgi:hypothetical protein
MKEKQTSLLLALFFLSARAFAVPGGERIDAAIDTVVTPVIVTLRFFFLFTPLLILFILKVTLKHRAFSWAIGGMCLIILYVLRNYVYDLAYGLLEPSYSTTVNSIISLAAVIAAAIVLWLDFGKSIQQKLRG